MARFNVISAKNNYGQEVIIRTIVRDGVTWYVVSDFCKGIDFPNTYSTKAYMSPENMDLLYANNKSYIIATYDGLKEMDGKFRNKRTVDHYKLLMQQISDKTRPIDPKRLEARFLAHAADFGVTQEAKTKTDTSAKPTVNTIKLQLWDEKLKQLCIRSIEKNGETWLFAADVCELIDYKNPSGLRVFFSPENYDKQEIDGKERLLINYAGMKQLKGRLHKKKTAAAYNVLMWNLEKDVFSQKKAKTEAAPEIQSASDTKEKDVTKYIKDNDESIGDILSTLINCGELLIDALKTIKAKRGEI